MFNVNRALYIVVIFAQSSRWTLQAMLMDGRINYLDWTVKPDQMMTLFPLVGFIFLITFDIIINPLLRLVGIRELWQKFTFSGILAVTAFIFAALLQLKIFVSPLKSISFGSKIPFTVVFKKKIYPTLPSPKNKNLFSFFKCYYSELDAVFPLSVY